MDETPARRFPLLLSGVALAAFALLIGLGLWQMERLAWKTRLIEAIEAGLVAEPVDIGVVAARLENGQPVEWMRARATGRFRHDQERHVYGLRGGRAGYQVATPLETDGGPTVWVDRGFVPEDRKDQATRDEGQPMGEVEVVGLVRLREDEASWFMPDNDVGRNVWITWDLDAMGRNADPRLAGPVLAASLEAQGAAPAGGYPIPWNRGTVELPNRHLEYALTWFGLAACLAGVYGAMLIARLRRKAP